MGGPFWRNLAQLGFTFRASAGRAAKMPGFQAFAGAGHVRDGDR
jgi:hypothetical protein